MNILFNPRPISQINKDEEEKVHVEDVEAKGAQALAEMTEVMTMQYAEIQGALAEISALIAGLTQGGEN